MTQHTLTPFVFTTRSKVYVQAPAHKVRIHHHFRYLIAHLDPKIWLGWFLVGGLLSTTMVRACAYTVGAFIIWRLFYRICWETSTQAVVVPAYVSRVLPHNLLPKKSWTPLAQTLNKVEDLALQGQVTLEHRKTFHESLWTLARKRKLATMSYQDLHVLDKELWKLTTDNPDLTPTQPLPVSRKPISRTA